MLRGRHRLRKDLISPQVYTSGLSLAQRQLTTIKNKTKNQQTLGQRERESDFQSDHVIKFKCPVFNKKRITRHTKKQESMAHSNEKNKPIETVPEKELTADLLEKDFKTTVSMLKELKEVMEKVKKMMYEQNVNINKEVKNLKRNQKIFSELKNIITEMKIHQRDSKANFSRQK